MFLITIFKHIVMIEFCITLSKTLLLLQKAKGLGGVMHDLSLFHFLFIFVYT